MTSLAALALGGLLACHRPAADPGPRSDPAPVPAPPPVAQKSAPAPDDATLVEETPERDPHSETVTIKLYADPARKARVFWGRKDLGLAPLEVTRPRGSGPLDLIVVAPRALTLHTRAFTDRDDKLTLHLYGENEGPALLGYRAEPSTDEPAPKGKVVDAVPRNRPSPPP